MIEEAQFRQAMGQYATGIAIATTLDKDGQPHGLTINSFNSVSLDPPLLLWSLARKSHQLDAFSSSGFYAVNILCQDQMDLSVKFAAPVEDRFAGVDWTKGTTGAPLISGTSSYFDCKVEKVLDGGDHVILLGRPVAMGHSEKAPLLYHGGAYHSLGPAINV